MKLRMKTMTIIGAVLAVCCAAVGAMPTQEELDKADALVQEVMKAEMDALRSGKKTREQVGDAAVALAKEAQAPAEKYLLLTGAFDQYMRGGAYEKAHSALTTLRTVLPDWKQSDEFSLIDKALRTLASGKGGPVRERYDALKERQQYAQRLKKALAQAKAKPSDKKLQFQVATYSAALGHWPHAVDAFLAANNPACADAAKLEKESAPPAKIADAWWSVVDIRPAFLSSAIRAHAVDLYKKALASNSLAGLQRVAAEKRIKEHEVESVVATMTPVEVTPSNRKSAKAYVQKGLAAQWDGIENAGFGKHVSGSSIWKDLIGGKDAKLSEGAHFEKDSLSLGKSLSYASWKGPLFEGDFTMEFVVSGEVCPGFNSIFVAEGDAWSLFISGQGFILKHSFASVRPGLSPIQIKPIYIQSRGGSMSIGYSDGSGKSSVVQLLGKTQAVNKQWYFGGHDQSHRFAGRFHAVRYYNRALSAAELGANLEIDKARFNLK